MPVNYLQHRIGINSTAPMKITRKSVAGNDRCSIPFRMSISLMLIFLLIGGNISNHTYNAQKVEKVSYEKIFNCKKYCRGDIYGIENEYSRVLQVINNKITKSKIGNRGTNYKIKFLQVNKGNSNFESKMYVIQDLIQKHRPNIICVSKANIKNKTFSN